MTRLTPKPGDLTIFRRALAPVQRMAAQVDWAGLDIEPLDVDLALIMRDLSEVADELARDMDAVREADDMRAMDRRLERDAELRELRALIGGVA